jgi:hypothetical protein
VTQGSTNRLAAGIAFLERPGRLLKKQEVVELPDFKTMAVASLGSDMGYALGPAHPGSPSARFRNAFSTSSVSNRTTFPVSFSAGIIPSAAHRLTVLGRTWSSFANSSAVTRLPIT